MRIHISKSTNPVHKPYEDLLAQSLRASAVCGLNDAIRIGLSPLGPDAQKVVCTMDVAQMASRVIQMSNAIYASTRNCDYNKIRRLKGRGPTSLEKEICTSSILIAMFNSQLLTGYWC